MRNHLFRKAGTALAILVAIGSFFFLVRGFFEGPRERIITPIPQEPSSNQQKGPIPPPLSTNEFSGTKESQSSSPSPSPEPGPAPAKSSQPVLELKSPAPSSTPEAKPSGKSSAKETKKDNAVAPLADTIVPSSPPKTPPSTPPKDSDKKVAVVKAGDTLYSIAAKAYQVANPSVVDMILEFNPKIKAPDQLVADQKVRLPVISDESLIYKTSTGSCKIWLGTFMKPEYAYFFKSTPVLHGKEIEIIPRPLPKGGAWYRVLAGIFETQEEALSTIAELKRQNLSPFFKGFGPKKEEGIPASTQ
jgi:hypothetical protein